MKKITLGISLIALLVACDDTPPIPKPPADSKLEAQAYATALANGKMDIATWNKGKQNLSVGLVTLDATQPVKVVALGTIAETGAINVNLPGNVTLPLMSIDDLKKSPNPHEKMTAECTGTVVASNPNMRFSFASMTYGEKNLMFGFQNTDEAKALFTDLMNRKLGNLAYANQAGSLKGQYLCKFTNPANPTMKMEAEVNYDLEFQAGWNGVFVQTGLNNTSGKVVMMMKTSPLPKVWLDLALPTTSPTVPTPPKP